MNKHLFSRIRKLCTHWRTTLRDNCAVYYVICPCNLVGKLLQWVLIRYCGFEIHGQGLFKDAKLREPFETVDFVEPSTSANLVDCAPELALRLCKCCTSVDLFTSPSFEPLKTEGKSRVRATANTAWLNCCWKMSPRFMLLRSVTEIYKIWFSFMVKQVGFSG